MSDGPHRSDLTILLSVSKRLDIKSKDPGISVVPRTSASKLSGWSLLISEACGVLEILSIHAQTIQTGHILVQFDALVHRCLALDVVWSELYEKSDDNCNVSGKFS